MRKKKNIIKSLQRVKAAVGGFRGSSASFAKAKASMLAKSKDIKSSGAASAGPTPPVKPSKTEPLVSFATGKTQEELNAESLVSDYRNTTNPVKSGPVLDDGGDEDFDYETEEDESDNEVGDTKVLDGSVVMWNGTTWIPAGSSGGGNSGVPSPGSLLNKEARKQRLASYDISLQKSLEGKLPEDAKVPDAVKIPSGAFDPYAMLEQAQTLPGFQEPGNSVDYNAETGNYTVTAFGMTNEMTPKEFTEHSNLNMGDFTSDEGGVKVKIDDQTGPTAKTATAVDEDVVKGDVTKAAVSGKVDSAGFLDAVRDLPLFKSGDGAVEYNPETGNYAVTAFGMTKNLTADELAEQSELDLNTYKKMTSASYKESKAGDVGTTTGAEGKVTTETGTDDLSFEDRNKVKTAGRDAAQEQAARAMAAERTGVSAENLIEQWGEQHGDQISTDMSSPYLNPETGRIEKFSESRGTVSWTPEEFAASYDLNFGKEYAEGVTTDERTIIDPSIELDRDDVSTREGEQISPEEIAKLREIARGRGLDIQQLRDEKPELFEQAKYRTAQTGTAKTGTAAELKDPVTLEAAEAEYQAAGDVAPGEADTIIAPPDFKKVGAREEQTGLEAQGKAQLVTGPDITTLRGRDAITGTIGDAEQTDVEEFDQFAAASRDGVTSEGVDPTKAATMAGQQADEVLRGTKTAVDVGDADAQVVDKSELPPFDVRLGREAKTGEFASRLAAKLGAPPEDVAAQSEYFGANPVVPGSSGEIDDVPAFEVASKRVAQVAEAASRIAAELGEAPSVDLVDRKAITGTEPQGDAAQIGGVHTMAAAKMQAVQGKERKMAAADMAGVVADLPPDITAAISESPANVTAELDQDADPNVIAAVAALPQEALVSVQMENLLAGMDDGVTPAWARPAVAAIERQMAQRGLSASSVGRDALFNAIIQSALPMAQSNAQALQQRAQQRLSNEQQANLAESQQIMQVRMGNLANRQTAASQIAQMAQQIKVQQGQFNQQAVMTEAQQGQESRMATAQFGQQRAQQESAQRQQAEVQILNAAQQTELANLQAESMRAGKQLDADQQAKLQTYNAKINKVMRQAELTQDMEKANISQSLQIEMQSISEQNAAAKDTMTAENQERLTDLQTLVDFRKTDAQFAQQMDLANMSNEQQVELANLNERAAKDAANFTTENQFKLQELNSIVQRNVRKGELDQDMEKANLDTSLRVELAELSEKNISARADMSSDQQMRLTNLQNLVDFKKTNEQMAQQMDMANMSNEQQLNMAELSDRVATDTANVTEANRFELQRLTTYAQFMSQNSEIRQQTELANFSQDDKLELANLASKNQASSENLTSRQQTSLANLDGRLKKATLDAQMEQEVITQTFSQAQQTDLANLEALNRADADSMTADQQTRLTKFNSSVQKELTQAQLYQDMEKVNLDKDLQLELTNLSNENIASKDTMTAENQERLVNLQNLVDFKKTNATMAQQMELANVSNEQQMRFAELQNRSEVDAANFTEDNRFELAGITANVQRNVRQAELNTRMEEVNLDSRLKIELTELSEKNVTERANMSSDQQMRLTKINTLMDFKKTNAQLAQQMELANVGNEQQIEMAELTDKAATDTANFTEANRVRSEELHTFVNVMSQNEQLSQQADLANLSMEEKISLANLSSRSQADMASMSAQNIAQLQVFEKKMQAGQVNAQLAQQMGLANLSNDQQASMFNAQIDANLDMKQFDADQQVELANSQFMKTMTVKDFDADQQSSMQNATTMAAMDMASADHNTKLKIENARNFLQMDMANLSNDQQAIVLDQQLNQQRLLSDQSAANAAKQFNAASENDINKFMSNMAKEVSLTNAAAANNMSQFNANANNAAEARDKNREADVSKFNATMGQDIAKFNADVTFRRDSWNAANAAAVEAADISSKRRRNEIDTATQNAINMQNASNSFKLSTQSLAFLNQEMRDQADMEFKSYESGESRIASIMIAALGAGENTFNKTDWTQGLGIQLTALTDLLGGS